MTKEHLPICGVGPFYGVGIIAATVIGLVIFLLGFFVWKAAALGSKSIDKYIESNTLCTTGVYSIVRR